MSDLSKRLRRHGAPSKYIDGSYAPASLCHRLHVEAADRIDVGALAIDSFESEVEKLEARIDELEAEVKLTRGQRDYENRHKLDAMEAYRQLKARIKELKDELLIERGRVDEYRAREADRG